MDIIAWEYISKGDTAAAASLFTSLVQSSEASPPMLASPAHHQHHDQGCSLPPLQQQHATVSPSSRSGSGRWGAPSTGATRATMASQQRAVDRRSNQRRMKFPVSNNASPSFPRSPMTQQEPDQQLNAETPEDASSPTSREAKKEEHRALARMCRVLADPNQVSQPHRDNDIVAALLDERIPTIAVFGPCLYYEEAQRIFNRKLAPFVHPDKNKHPQAHAAFQRLQKMRDECKELLPRKCDGDDSDLEASDCSAPASPLYAASPKHRRFNGGGNVDSSSMEDSDSSLDMSTLRRGNRKLTKREQNELLKQESRSNAKKKKELNGLLSSMKQSANSGVSLSVDLSSERYNLEKTVSELEGFKQRLSGGVKLTCDLSVDAFERTAQLQQERASAPGVSLHRDGPSASLPTASDGGKPLSGLRSRGASNASVGSSGSASSAVHGGSFSSSFTTRTRGHSVASSNTEHPTPPTKGHSGPSSSVRLRGMVLSQRDDSNSSHGGEGDEDTALSNTIQSALLGQLGGVDDETDTLCSTLSRSLAGAIANGGDDSDSPSTTTFTMSCSNRGNAGTSQLRATLAKTSPTKSSREEGQSALQRQAPSSSTWSSRQEGEESRRTKGASGSKPVSSTPAASTSKDSEYNRRQKSLAMLRGGSTKKSKK